MINIVDEIESQEESKGNGEKSFVELPYEKDDENSQKLLLEWLKKERDYLSEENRERFELMRKNLALNKGVMYKEQNTRGDREITDTKKSVVEKMVINKLKEASRVRASKLLKYKPNVSILPTNDELSDKIAAEQTKNLLDHVWYLQRYDGIILPRLIMHKGPLGEMYNKITWNPNAGDVAQQYKDALNEAKAEARKVGQDEKMVKVPMMGEDGKQMKNESGEPIYVERPIKNGDVEYNAILPLDLLFDKHPSNAFENSRYSFEREVMLIDEARIAYPKATKNIKAEKEVKVYDYEKGEFRTIRNAVVVWHFYHRRTDYFEKGRYVVFTNDGILSNKKFPYSHRRLPYVRHIDLENPGEMHGVSFFDDCKQIFGAFNNINNMILRNEMLVGHPKWMMPAGAADIRELGNAITVVQYKGPVAPQLVQANPTGQGAYNLRNVLKEEGMEAADVSRTGNGNPPAGITAAVALQFLSELEQERWNVAVLFHNESILQTVQMTLAVCGDYYDPDDKRQIRLQGEDGEWQSVFFDSTNLSKDYDVRIQGASALPETKAARLETLMYLAKNFPSSVDVQEILNMMDLAQDKKYIRESTISVRAAEAENEAIMKGLPTLPPEKFEDHVTHWKAHVRQSREWSFKNRATNEVKKALIDHIRATEMFMSNEALKNPQYIQLLATLPGFPIYFEVKPESPLDPKEEPPILDNMDMPMNIPPDQPIAQPGMDVQEDMPPIDQQTGIEPVEPPSQNEIPTNQV